MTVRSEHKLADLIHEVLPRRVACHLIAQYVLGAGTGRGVPVAPALVLPEVVGAPVPRIKKFRILTWNLLHVDKVQVQPNRESLRESERLKIIAAARPDVLCAQECTESMRRILVENGFDADVGITPPKYKHGTQHTFGLSRDAHHVRIPISTSTQKHALVSFVPAAELIIINIHLTARYTLQPFRLQEIGSLLASLRGLEQTYWTIVICGDWNCDASDDEFHMFSGDWQRIRYDGASYDPQANDWLRACNPKGRAQQMDHFVIRPGRRFKSARAKRITGLADQYSDHYPVQCDISLRS